MQNLQPLSSAYGLAKHRDGRWEWAIAPGVSPSPRYQHAAVSFFCLINFYTKLFLSLINFYKSPLWSLCNACYLLFIRFLSMHDFMCREVLLEVGGWWKTPRMLQVLVLKSWSDSHFMYQVVKYLLKNVLCCHHSLKQPLNESIHSKLNQVSCTIFSSFSFQTHIN